MDAAQDHFSAASASDVGGGAQPGGKGMVAADININFQSGTLVLLHNSLPFPPLRAEPHRRQVMTPTLRATARAATTLSHD